jgi:hypothetical protein
MQALVGDAPARGPISLVAHLDTLASDLSGDVEEALIPVATSLEAAGGVTLKALEECHRRLRRMRRRYSTAYGSLCDLDDLAHRSERPWRRWAESTTPAVLRCGEQIGEASDATVDCLSVMLAEAPAGQAVVSAVPKTTPDARMGHDEDH